MKDQQPAFARITFPVTTPVFLRKFGVPSATLTVGNSVGEKVTSEDRGVGEGINSQVTNLITWLW